MKIRKAIIPVAGLGTRFLPASKAVPKVLLPVFDTPAIHFVVNEALYAGIEHLIFVISPQQDMIKNYFSNSSELELELGKRGHPNKLDEIKYFQNNLRLDYVYQSKQLGLGHAILLAEKKIDREPFAVLLPDDIISPVPNLIAKLIEISNDKQACSIALKEVPDKLVPSLGIVKAKSKEENIYSIDSLVEKPSITEAPSNLAVIGRYILTPNTFEILKNTRPGIAGEIQLTDALSQLIQSQSIYGYQFPGIHFDVGTPIGLLKASTFRAINEDEYEEEFREWFNKIL